jgi:hypothetical protein
MGKGKRIASGWWLVCVVALWLVGVASTSEAGTLTAVLTWQNTDTTDAVQIDRAPASAGPFTKLSTVPAGTLTYTDATNNPGDTVCYRVENFNSSGNGPSSNVACKTFPPVPTVAPVLSPIQ